MYSDYGCGLICGIPTESRALTITTFAKDRIQRRSNSSNSPKDEYEQVQEKVYYTQAPENVVIKVHVHVYTCIFYMYNMH